MKKRLFALLLAMLMVCALLPAAAMAEAGEATEEPAEAVEEAVEPEGETEEPEEEPAPELVEASEEVEEVEEEAPLLGGKPPFKAAKGFVSGQKYVIGYDEGGTLYFLKDNAGTLTVASFADADAAGEDSGAVWTATTSSSGALLSNGSDNLYYKNGYLTTDNKGNWNFTSDSTLYYDAGGKKQYMTVSSGAFSFGTDSAAATVMKLYTDGPEEGTASGGGSGDSGGGDSGDSGSTVTYTESNKLDKAYVAVVDISTGKPLGFDPNTAGSITVTGDKPKRTIDAGKGYCIAVTAGGGDGATLSLEDPPGTPNYMYVDETGAFCNSSSEGDYAHWFVSGDGVPYYKIGETRYYFDTIDGKNSTMSTAKNMNILAFTGDEASNGGGGGGGSTTDALAPVIDSESFTDGAAFKVGDPAGAMNFALTASPSTGAAEKGVTAADLTYQWYVSTDGVNFEGLAGETKAALSVKPDTSEVGTRMYQCKVSCVIDGEEHSTLSSLGAYFVVNGVKEDSIMMFSDVHEEWDNIYGAFNTLLMKNGGYLPSLLMGTGDFVNGNGGTADDTVAAYNNILARNLGIQTIGISGNHDNGDGMNQVIAELAKTDPEINKDFNGKNKLYESEHVIVFGINYNEQEGGYAALKTSFDEQLGNLSTDQQKKAIIFIAHAGLHVVNNLTEDALKSYNLDGSDEFAKMLNEYADKGLNISFFYGHNHSKGDPNQMLNPGQSITATKKFAEQTSEQVTLQFTYGTLGFLNTNIGGGGNFGYLELTDKEQKTVLDLAANYEATLPTNYTDPEPVDDDDEGGKSGKGVAKTGDESTPVLWAVVIVSLAAVAVVLPKKKHN